MKVVERFGADAVLIDFRSELSPEWRRAAIHGTLAHSRHVVREAADDPGNAEGETRPLDYRVVPGPLARSVVPELFALYAQPKLLQLIAEEFGLPGLEVCPDEVSGFNVNILVGEASYYKWHIDLAPYTLIFFVTSMPEAAGGALRFKRADGRLNEIAPLAGYGLVINGTKVPHCVTPLASDYCRITIAAEYVVPGQALQGTHAALSNYVF